MRTVTGRLCCALVMVLVGSRVVFAQEADTTHRYSVFAGATLAAQGGDFGQSLSKNIGLGPSLDFAARSALFRPRVTVSFDQWRTLSAPTPLRVVSAVGEGM